MKKKSKPVDKGKASSKGDGGEVSGLKGAAAKPGKYQARSSTSGKLVSFRDPNTTARAGKQASRRIKSIVGKPANPDQSKDVVSIHEFRPDRGVLVLESGRQRVRYTREKTAEQVYAMADYLRARRGFATDQGMAEILGVHRTRLIAWKQGMDVPNARNAQLLSHLAVVVRELEEFLDPDVIPDWLLTEQYTLGNRTPVDALREGHLAEVLQAANATEYGAYV